ncbi:MAG: SapC family protein [Proteobacteria bacterium]|nr:SapC family protein [Pseudomonadota bacterium]
MSAGIDAGLMKPSEDNSDTGIAGYHKLVPVETDRLLDMGISQQSCQRFAASQNISPLNLLEFFHALPYYPVVFTRQQDKTFLPCAVLGLHAGENLFVDAKGDWVPGVYHPAYIRRYPFITQAITSDELTLQDDEIKKPIFVDEAALDRSAESLFIANNIKTDQWKTIEAFVAEYISAERQTLLFTKKLAALDLLQPFDAQIHQNKADTLRLKGLYRVNEDKLNQLPSEVIRELMQSGELSRIYAHLISLENFAKLLDVKATKQSCKF